MKIFKFTLTIQVFILLFTACKTKEPEPYVHYGKPYIYNSTAIVTTIAGLNSVNKLGDVDGNLTTARFGILGDLAFDSQKNLFVIDYTFNKIRKITPSGEVTTFASNITKVNVDRFGENALIIEPTGIVIDRNDNLFITDFTNNCIHKITPSGEITIFAGSTAGIKGTVDGNGTDARFYQPLNLAIDIYGNLYLTQCNNNLRKITPSGTVTTLSGINPYGFHHNPSTPANLHIPIGVVVAPDQNIYVTNNNIFGDQILKINSTGIVSVFAGSTSNTSQDGVGLSAQFRNPELITVDSTGNLFVTDLKLLRKVTNDSIVSTIAGGNGNPYIEDGVGCNTSFGFFSGITLDSDGNIYITEECLIRKITIK